MTLQVDPQWSYDALARSYDHRPDYDATLIGEVLTALSPGRSIRVLEIGAGTGKFTAHLCNQGWDVTAIEPSASMRGYALAKPAAARAQWVAAVGESLPIRSGAMDVVAYASSLNCLRPDRALAEAFRVLNHGGHLLALWNYRDLDDPLQSSVEDVLSAHVAGYDPGARRNAPMDDPAIAKLFGNLRVSERRFIAEVDSERWIDAWNAHRTIVGQAGDRMPLIIDAISSLIAGRTTVNVPYTTRIWTASVRK